MPLDEIYVRYLNGLSVGRLATVGPDGAPQNKPVAYHYNPASGTIDIGGFNMGGSAKYRNVGINPRVALVVDDAIGEGPSGLRFLEVRGHAEQARVDAPIDEGPGSYLIRIHPRRVVSWNVDPEHPGKQTRDLTDADPH
jgi:pyridoxamine 5'-phosphate oxidase family protein